MITLNDFIEMSDIDKCNLINKHLQNHTQKTFKQGEIGFTFKQADKVLSECGIYCIEGSYRTSGQALDFLEQKKKEQDRKSFSPEQMERLIRLASCDGFENLLNLADKYSYISTYILNQSNEIHLQPVMGTPRQTSIRIYDDTWKKWQSFIASNKEYTAINLLNTALLDFMKLHS